MRRTLCICPARGGSKGLPGKNIKPLLGVPLIIWSLRTAQQLTFVDSLYVSTDDPDIADVVCQHDFDVPELRPVELAADNTPSCDVILHCLDMEARNGRLYDDFILLEPTSPLRDVAILEDAYARFVERDADAMVSVGRHNCTHPDFSYGLTGGILSRWDDRADDKPARRQEVSDAYFLDGSFYLAKVDAYRRHKSFLHAGTMGFEVNKIYNFEIDDHTDFQIVEALAKVIWNDN